MMLLARVTYQRRSSTPVVQEPPAAALLVWDRLNLGFSAPEGGADPAMQTIEITNGRGVAAGGTAFAGVTLDTTGTASWCSPVVNDNGNDTFTIANTIDITGLTAGTYQTTYQFDDSNADNGPRTVTVTLTIVASGQLAAPLFDLPVVDGVAVTWDGSVAVTASTSPFQIPSISAPANLLWPADFTPATAAELQTAWNAARTMPSPVIQLTAGVNYDSASYVLQMNATRTGTGTCVIRTGTALLRSAGTRIDGTENFARLRVSGNGGNRCVHSENSGRLAVWFEGVEFTQVNASGQSNSSLLLFGQAETTLAALPSDVVLSHCWAHCNSASVATHGISFNGERCRVLDSWIRIYQQGSQAQGFSSWAGSGNILLYNNLIEASGENILFGGGDPKIAGVIPTDIIISRNTLRKDPAWKGVYSICNLLEFKHGDRILVERNRLDGTWEDVQRQAIAIKTNNNTGAETWAVTRNVTLRYNRLENIGGAIVTVLGYDASNSPNVADRTNRVEIRDLLVDNVQTGIYTASKDETLRPWVRCRDIVMHYCTVIAPTQGSGTRPLDCSDSGSGISCDGLTFRNNIGYGSPGEFARGPGTTDGKTSLDAYMKSLASGTPNYVFDHNALVGSLTQSRYANLPGTPTPVNFFPANTAAVGFENSAARDWRLAAGSPYKNASTDGIDLGADVASVEAGVTGI